MSNGNGHHWSKFSWRDWHSDIALHPCSLAARGFWLELLCMMHEGSPIGHLASNGRAVTLRQMAANAGCSEKQALKLLAELEEANVFSRTTEGIIFSRRMVRDGEASDTGREHAERRWNGHRPNGPPNGGPNGGGNGYPTGEPSRGPYGDPNAENKNVESEEEPEEEFKESVYKHLPEGPVSAPGRAREAPAAADPDSEDADVPSLDEIMRRRREFAEAPSPLAEGIASLASAMRMKAYPPREPLRPRNDQAAIVGEVRRPQPHHLSREQINQQLRMVRRRQ